ncbi:MAG: metalloprotease TldD, partial [Gammaproteobacteria bacterium]|nr:metalloprotease TldD [Gammaproteobacteria bacterium]NIO61323.1 metalloprotease TldD [Gammaproteobacteria bacterium]
MDQYLDIAQRQLLTPVGMEISDIHDALGELGRRDIDQADLYFESSRSESWVLEEGIIKEGSHNIQQGVGVRAISGEKTGFAYSDEIHLPSLNNAAKAARAIASSGDSSSIQAWQKQNIAPLYSISDPLESIPADSKVALLKKVDEIARNKDPRVKEVIASLAGEYSTVLIAGIDGTYTADVRPLVRLNVSV